MPGPGADEHLAHHRLDVFGGLGQAAVVGRNVAPAEQHLPFVADGAFDHRLAGAPAGVAARQEDHADTVFAGRRQGHALLRHFGAEKLVGNLDQDAGAIAKQRIVARGTAMFEVFRISRPCSMMAWLFWFLIWATKPTPQASRSFSGS
jgi:hypothetical protein